MNKIKALDNDRFKLVLYTASTADQNHQGICGNLRKCVWVKYTLYLVDLNVSRCWTKTQWPLCLSSQYTPHTHASTHGLMHLLSHLLTYLLCHGFSLSHTLMIIEVDIIHSAHVWIWSTFTLNTVNSYLFLTHTELHFSHKKQDRGHYI